MKLRVKYENYKSLVYELKQVKASNKKALLTRHEKDASQGGEIKNRSSNKSFSLL